MQEYKVPQEKSYWYCKRNGIVYELLGVHDSSQLYGPSIYSFTLWGGQNHGFGDLVSSLQYFYDKYDEVIDRQT